MSWIRVTEPLSAAPCLSIIISGGSRFSLFSIIFPGCRYDGQVFVKPPEVLARDRLLGTYEVKPVLARLRCAEARLAQIAVQSVNLALP